MAARRRTVAGEEAGLPGLLRGGDIAGSWKAVGGSRSGSGFGWPADDDFRDEDEDGDEDEALRYDADDGDWRLWPDWPDAGRAGLCTALHLGMCCKHPVDPLVRRAAEIADSVHRTLGRAGQGECALMAAQTSRLLLSVYGLLAQVHAVLPGASRATAAQLLCPVGRLASAVAAIRAQGCPWACGDPSVPDRRPEFAPLATLLEECSAALRAALDQRR